MPRPTFHRLALSALALLLPFASAQAADPVVQPGLWEFRMEISAPGGMTTIPAQTLKRCLTAKDIAENRHIAPNDPKNPCSVSNVKNSGGKFSYDLACKTGGQSMTGSATGTVAAESFDLQSKMRFSPSIEGLGEVQQRMTGKRIGTC